MGASASDIPLPVIEEIRREATLPNDNSFGRPLPLEAHFMLDEAYRFNPEFWFEISTWDGHEPSKENDKRRFYANQGQTYDPERYGGTVQFGMWLLRPRVVREFRGWTDTLTNSEAYFLSIVDAVDRVHNNTTLRSFWRQGKLVANRAHPHLYQSNVPEEYQNVDRWFLLDTNLDPKRPWNLHTEILVFSLALVLGQAPEREWLVYAHAPLNERKNVKVTLPDYGTIKIDVSASGTFYHIGEKTKKVSKVTDTETNRNLKLPGN